MALSKRQSGHTQKDLDFGPAELSAGISTSIL